MNLSLIRRCQAGDEEAFSALFENYKNLVYRIAYLTLGNSADAEDILQEVFLQVHRSLANYDSTRSAFATWLNRITVNKCLNSRRRRRFFIQSLEELPDDVIGEPIISEEQCVEIELLKSALNRLSKKLRVVLILRHFLDLSYAEIAEILNLPLGTVKSRLNLALRTLHKELKHDDLLNIQSFTEVSK